MHVEMGRGVARAVDAINALPDVRAVLVRGAGDVFCAGGDLEMLAERSRLAGDENRRGMLDFYRSFLSIRELRAPSIAVIRGAAIGAGACFAIACDLRVMASDAKIG